MAGQQYGKQQSHDAASVGQDFLVGWAVPGAETTILDNLTWHQRAVRTLRIGVGSCAGLLAHVQVWSLSEVAAQ